VICWVTCTLVLF